MRYPQKKEEEGDSNCTREISGKNKVCVQDMSKNEALLP